MPPRPGPQDGNDYTVQPIGENVQDKLCLNHQFNKDGW